MTERSDKAMTASGTLAAMAADPGKARSELEARLRREHPEMTDAQVAQELELVEATLGI